jgi:predicted DNA-binding protein (MmcQ/YjbR family)
MRSVDSFWFESGSRAYRHCYSLNFASMDIDQFRDYCLQKGAVTEETPFGPDTLVYKVMGKAFALCGIDSFDGVNLKCDPEKAIDLRERYDGITPGYHMNKKHWNTLATDGRVPPRLFFELIDHSYELVVAGLPKKDRAKLHESEQ